MPEHFKGCHPEHEEGPPNPEGYEPQPVEECWHCQTPTPKGCKCRDCWEDQDNIPPEAVYHCPLCFRWWAHMYLNITSLHFPGRPDA